MVSVGRVGEHKSLGITGINAEDFPCHSLCDGKPLKAFGLMSDRDRNSGQSISMVIVFFCNVSLLSGKHRYAI